MGRTPESGSTAAGPVIVIGQLLMDVIATFRGPAEPGGQVLADVQFVRGGSAANLASFLKRFGFEVRLLAQIGEDDFGTRLEQSLTEAGVTPCVVREGRSGVCLSLVQFFFVRQDEDAVMTLSPQLGEIYACEWFSAAEIAHIETFAQVRALASHALVNHPDSLSSIR